MTPNAYAKLTPATLAPALVSSPPPFWGAFGLAKLYVPIFYAPPGKYPQANLQRDQLIATAASDLRHFPELVGPISEHLWLLANPLFLKNLPPGYLTDTRLWQAVFQNRPEKMTLLAKLTYQCRPDFVPPFKTIFWSAKRYGNTVSFLHWARRDPHFTHAVARDLLFHFLGNLNYSESEDPDPRVNPPLARWRPEAKAWEQCNLSGASEAELLTFLDLASAHSLKVPLRWLTKLVGHCSLPQPTVEKIADRLLDTGRLNLTLFTWLDKQTNFFWDHYVSRRPTLMLRLMHDSYHLPFFTKVVRQVSPTTWSKFSTAHPDFLAKIIDRTLEPYANLTEKLEVLLASIGPKVCARFPLPARILTPDKFLTNGLLIIHSCLRHHVGLAQQGKSWETIKVLLLIINERLSLQTETTALVKSYLLNHDLAKLPLSQTPAKSLRL